MSYTGPVTYADGWHYAVVIDAAGVESLGEKLYLDDDGTYRPAVDADESWHDRKNRGVVAIVPEGGAQQIVMTASEAVATQELLTQLRGEGEG